MKSNFAFISAVIIFLLAIIAFSVAHTADAATTVCNIFNGCTGTSTTPAYGQVLIGGKNGEYELVASSTFGGGGSGSGSVTSVQLASPNSTFSISGTNPVTTSGTINADLNLTHSNWWSARQNFTNATTSGFEATSTNVFFDQFTSALLGTNSSGQLVATTSIGNNLLAASGVSGSSCTNCNLSYNSRGIITVASNGTAGSASSTLLTDNNTFSGIDSFTSASSNFGGTWQTFSPSHFDTYGWPWTIATYNGTTSNATSTQEHYIEGFSASSTSQLVNASTTEVSASSFCLNGSATPCITSWPSGGSSASSTLLSDNNTFSGNDSFTSASSNFSGTWQTFSPSHFLTGNQTITLSGDVTGSGATSIATTFNVANAHWWQATQNFTNASTSQLTATSSVIVSYLTSGQLVATDGNDKLVSTTTIGSNQISATGVSAGSYTNTNLTVNAQGQITSASNGSSGGGSLPYTAWGGSVTQNQSTSTIASTTMPWMQEGLTASSTSWIDNLVVNNTFSGAGLASCNGTANAINYNSSTQQFGCGSSFVTKTFLQGSAPIQYSSVTGAISVASPFAVQYGGTGQSTLPGGQLLYGNTTGNVGSVATTSATCSGTVSCSGFTVIGPSPITITGSAGTAASSTLLTDNNTFSGQINFSQVSIGSTTPAIWSALTVGSTTPIMVDSPDTRHLNEHEHRPCILNFPSRLLLDECDDTHYLPV